MKFGKESLGVIVEGATLHSPEEQGFVIVDFAIEQGFEIDLNEYAKAKDEYKNEYDDLTYDWFEEFGFLVEDAVDYLNKECTEEGFIFGFNDSHFMLESIADYE